MVTLDELKDSLQESRERLSFSYSGLSSLYNYLVEIDSALLREKDLLSALIKRYRETTHAALSWDHKLRDSLGKHICETEFSVIYEVLENTDAKCAKS